MSGLAAQQFQNKLMQLAIENANIAKPQYLQIVKEGLYQPAKKEARLRYLSSLDKKGVEEFRKIEKFINDQYRQYQLEQRAISGATNRDGTIDKERALEIYGNLTKEEALREIAIREKGLEHDEEHISNKIRKKALEQELTKLKVAKNFDRYRDIIPPQYPGRAKVEAVIQPGYSYGPNAKDRVPSQIVRPEIPGISAGPANPEKTIKEALVKIAAVRNKLIDDPENKQLTTEYKGLIDSVNNLNSYNRQANGHHQALAKFDFEFNKDYKQFEEALEDVKKNPGKKPQYLNEYITIPETLDPWSGKLVRDGKEIPIEDELRLLSADYDRIASRVAKDEAPTRFLNSRLDSFKTHDELLEDLLENELDETDLIQKVREERLKRELEFAQTNKYETAVEESKKKTQKLALEKNVLLNKQKSIIEEEQKITENRKKYFDQINNLQNKISATVKEPKKIIKQLYKDQHLFGENSGLDAFGDNVTEQNILQKIIQGLSNYKSRIESRPEENLSEPFRFDLYLRSLNIPQNPKENNAEYTERLLNALKNELKEETERTSGAETQKLKKELDIINKAVSDYDDKLKKLQPQREEIEKKLESTSKNYEEEEQRLAKITNSKEEFEKDFDARKIEFFNEQKARDEQNYSVLQGEISRRKREKELDRLKKANARQIELEFANYKLPQREKDLLEKENRIKELQKQTELDNAKNIEERNKLLLETEQKLKKDKEELIKKHTVDLEKEFSKIKDLEQNQKQLESIKNKLEIEKADLLKAASEEGNKSIAEKLLMKDQINTKEKELKKAEEEIKKNLIRAERSEQKAKELELSKIKAREDYDKMSTLGKQKEEQLVKTLESLKNINQSKDSRLKELESKILESQNNLKEKNNQIDRLAKEIETRATKEKELTSEIINKNNEIKKISDSKSESSSRKEIKLQVAEKELIELNNKLKLTTLEKNKLTEDNRKNLIENKDIENKAKRLAIDFELTKAQLEKESKKTKLLSSDQKEVMLAYKSNLETKEALKNRSEEIVNALSLNKDSSKKITLEAQKELEVELHNTNNQLSFIDEEIKALEPRVKEIQQLEINENAFKKKKAKLTSQSVYGDKIEGQSSVAGSLRDRKEDFFDNQSSFGMQTENDWDTQTLNRSFSQNEFDKALEKRKQIDNEIKREKELINFDTPENALLRKNLKKEEIEKNKNAEILNLDNNLNTINKDIKNIQDDKQKRQAEIEEKINKQLQEKYASERENINKKFPNKNNEELEKLLLEFAKEKEQHEYETFSLPKQIRDNKRQVKNNATRLAYRDNPIPDNSHDILKELINDHMISKRGMHDELAEFRDDIDELGGDIHSPQNKHILKNSQSYYDELNREIEKESMELWNKNLLPKINVGLATMGMTNSSPANQIKQNSFNDVMKALNKQKQENKLQHYKNSINDFRLGQKEKAEKAQLKLDSMGVGSNHLTKHSGELQNLLKRKWLDDQVAHDLIQAEYDAKDMENKQINEQAMQQQQEEYNHYHDTHNKLMGNKVNTDGPGNVLRGATQTNQQIPGPSGFGITGELIGNITKAGMQMYNDAEEKRHRRNMEIAAQMPNHNNQTNRP